MVLDLPVLKECESLYVMRMLTITGLVCRHRAVHLANHSFRFMWGPEKSRTDIEKGAEVEVDVPTRVRLQ
jgi:hypothetical protein